MTTESPSFGVPGLPGHWHKSLELPCGYQHFNWYRQGENPNGVWLDNPAALEESLRWQPGEELYLYTQHEIFLQDAVLKHTRSSPNWDGGVVTFATCKHLMRTYARPGGWEGVWLAGLCPKECASNTVLFVGRIDKAFQANYDLRRYLQREHPGAAEAKRALNNPRGDLYTPTRVMADEDGRYDHRNYLEPANHTRSVEFYKNSPGSTSERPDGKIPKWWRDLEYLQRGTRPPCFTLSPCYLFSRPQVWTTYNPRRAVLRLTAGGLAGSLRTAPASA